MSTKEEQPLVSSAIKRPLRTALGRSAYVVGLAACLFGLGSAWAPAAFADAAPGDLDASFGGDGRVVTDFGAIDIANGVAVQPDGRIVAAGGRITMAASDFALARYNPDGSLDPSFAGNGTLRTSFGGEEVATAVAIQPDGRIVAAGEASDGDGKFALARYDPDGSLDTGFGGDGTVLTDIGGGDDGANAVAIQPDGKIVVAGNTAFGGGNFGVARYHPDGSLDLSFEGNGKLEIGLGGEETAYAVAIQDDGRIVVAGSTDIGDGGFALVRLDTDGSPDPTFDGDGLVYTDQNVDTGARAVAIQDDGRIVAAGASDVGDSDFALSRYMPDGSLDPGFDGNGSLRTDFGGGEEVARAVAIQADGRIVAAGERAPGNADFALARYAPDGSLDASFGGDGRVLTEFGEFDFATGGAIQPDGRIVAAGGRTSMGGGGEFALARYHSVAEATPGPPPDPADPDEPGPGESPDLLDTEVTIRINGKRLAFNRKRIARAKLTCPASEASPPCSGTLRLKTRRKVRFKNRKRRVVLARSKRFEIDAGETGRVKLRLSKPKRKLVRSAKRARRTRAIVKVRDQAGNRAKVRKKLRARAR
jgi:uncharacterized delta-60 repeat protein